MTAVMGPNEPRPQSYEELRKFLGDRDGVMRCRMCMRPEEAVPVLVICGIVALCPDCIRRAGAALDEYEHQEQQKRPLFQLKDLVPPEDAEVKSLADGVLVSPKQS